MAQLSLSRMWVCLLIVYPYCNTRARRARLFACESNRAKPPKKALLFQRVKYLELELPPWVILGRPRGRIFWPKAGVLVLRRSLGNSM